MGLLKQLLHPFYVTADATMGNAIFASAINLRYHASSGSIAFKTTDFFFMSLPLISLTYCLFASFYVFQVPIGAVQPAEHCSFGPQCSQINDAKAAF